jgi:hypothetical protein
MNKKDIISLTENIISEKGGVNVKKKIAAVALGITLVFSVASYVGADNQEAMNKAEFVSA